MKKIQKNPFSVLKAMQIGCLIALSLGACKPIDPKEPAYNNRPVLISQLDTLLQIVDDRVTTLINPDGSLRRYDILFDGKPLIDTFYNFYLEPRISLGEDRLRIVRTSKECTGGFCDMFALTPDNKVLQGLLSVNPNRDNRSGSYKAFYLTSKWRGKTVKLTIKAPDEVFTRTDNGILILDINGNPIYDTIKGDVYYEGDVSFPISGAVRLHMLDSEDPTKIKVFPEIFDRVPPLNLNGKFRLRVLNLYGNMINTTVKDVRVTLANGTTLFENVPAASLSEFVELPMGTHLIEIKLSNGEIIYANGLGGTVLQGENLIYHWTQSDRHVFTGKPGGTYTIVIEDRLLTPLICGRGGCFYQEKTIEVLWREETDFISGVEYGQYGKVQLINVHPDLSSIEANINGKALEGAISYGKNSFWEIIPSGTGTIDIKDASGAQILNNTFSIPPNGQLLAFVVPSQTDGSPQLVYYNYQQAPLSTYVVDPSAQFKVKEGTSTTMANVCMRFLNLSPDAGQVEFTAIQRDTITGKTNTMPIGLGYNNISFAENLRAIPYYVLSNLDATTNSGGIFPGKVNGMLEVPDPYAFRSYPPIQFGVRASTAFPAVAGEIINAAVDIPFKIGSLPGFYSVALIGYRNPGNDTNKKIKMIIIDHNK